jgi:hypothetical protein
MTALIDIVSLLGLLGCLHIQLADESRRREDVSATMRPRVTGARIARDDASLTHPGVSRYMLAARDSDERASPCSAEPSGFIRR